MLSNIAYRATAPLGPDARLWTDPGASTDLLQSMGLSLDSLFGQNFSGDSTRSATSQSGSTNAPLMASYTASSAGQNRATSWPTPGVFDELFGGSDLFGVGLAHM